jgi:hypothetical protein
MAHGTRGCMQAALSTTRARGLSDAQRQHRALEQTVAKAKDPTAVRQGVAFEGEWRVAEGQTQFRATIAFPMEKALFEVDFPPHGRKEAPNPLACATRQAPPLDG